jgi:UDPglucose 6-dehydrogenase
MMKVTILGTGYVGLSVGAGFADFGLQVTCADIDASRIQNLQRGSVPIFEPGLEELVKRHLKSQRLCFTTDLRGAIRAAQVIFITVGTASLPDGSTDLSQVEMAGKEIAQNLDGFKLLVLKSTVPVGTCRRFEELIRSHSMKGVEFEVASNPEFLREGSAVQDFMRPDRVVIGAQTERGAGILREIYRPLYLIETPFVFTTLETAELIKYAANSFLAVKISFTNEIANLCDAFHADVHVVAKAMGLDQRIGSKFLHPGPGFGGSCLPKDCRALVHMARQAGIECSLVESALNVNDRQYTRVIRKLKDGLGTLADKTVAIWGLSFKPNTSDIRESRAIAICQDLLKEGCTLRVYDPVAQEGAQRVLGHVEIRYCCSPVEAVEGADGVVLATEWNEFRNLDLSVIKSRMRGDVFVDARNVYEIETAKSVPFRYFGIGRG